MRVWSLKQRMTLISAIVILVAFSFIYIITKSAYSIASKARIQESLVGQIYGLMADAHDRDAQLFLPKKMRNDRLNHLNSGLVAYVLDVDGDLIWRSHSSDNFSVLPEVSLPYSLKKLTSSVMERQAMFWVGDIIIWEHENGMEGEYLFLIGETQSLLNASVNAFKKQVFIWLSISAVFLIVVLVYALNVSLRPLNTAKSQIELVGCGDADKVTGEFPAELLPLTSSINQLLDSEARQKARYRDTLGNLAHSLKTPLAIIKSELNQATKQEQTGEVRGTKALIAERDQREQLQKQVERIDDIVRYQLNRSVVTAGQALKRKTLVEPEIKKIVEALNKVHASRQLNIEYHIDSHCYFPGEIGDLMEVVGNLSDNACKWAKSQVIISASQQSDVLVLEVEDDGVGIPEAKRSLILDRGKRLDQKAEGQGLGLSIVMDIIKNYCGDISIKESSLGGTEFLLKIPL